MTEVSRVIVAGTAFPSIKPLLSAELPEAEIQVVEPDDLRRESRAADVLVPAMNRVDGDLMDRLHGLRLIHQRGAGLEVVDFLVATLRGIMVANVPAETTGNAVSVAEWCVMAAIAVSRHLSEAIAGIREGSLWGGPMGRTLVGHTAGIVGMGGIGQALAARLRPFGMRLIGVKRTADPSLAAQLGLDWLGGADQLPTLLRQSDYLFLCLPLTEQTRGLIDERAMALLPPDACVVNPGRGGLLSPDARLRALAEKRLIGAALDVFGQEPLDPASPLLNRPEILATPHIAGVTHLSYGGIARAIAANVRRLSAGEPLANCVNREEINRGQRPAQARRDR